MTDLTGATGLKKVSLYHRFPEGKSSMDHAILDSIVNWTETNVVQVINYSKKSPSERLDEVLRLIDELQQGGELDCILRALSHGSASTLFKQKIGSIFKSQIQGTLILSVTLGDKSLFSKVLIEIRGRFLAN